MTVLFTRVRSFDPRIAAAKGSVRRDRSRRAFSRHLQENTYFSKISRAVSVPKSFLN